MSIKLKNGAIGAFSVGFSYNGIMGAAVSFNSEF